MAQHEQRAQSYGTGAHDDRSVTGLRLALPGNVHAHGQWFYQGAFFHSERLGQFEQRGFVLFGIAHQEKRSKSALRSTVANGIAVGHGVDDHSITVARSADPVAGFDHHA